MFDMCRNALVSRKCVEACCAVVSWDGTDPYRVAERSPIRVESELQKTQQFLHLKVKSDEEKIQ